MRLSFLKMKSWAFGPPRLSPRDMKRLNRMLLWGLAGALLSLAFQARQFRGEIESLEHEKVALITQQNTLRLEKQKLAQEYDRLQYIQDLAVEFSMDPTIVNLVDQYSREYMRSGGDEWRLLRTPEFTSYIMLSLIHAESRGNPGAIGDSGRARGLTQIWVSTAREYGSVTPQQLHHPETNISFSFQHFHYLLKKYHGNIALTLYAWNRGAAKVDGLLRYGESPENGYAKKIYEAAMLNNRNLVQR